MKKYAAAIAYIAAATVAQAGSYDAPVDPPLMPPVVIQEEAASSSAPSAGLVLGLITVTVFGAALANN